MVGISLRRALRRSKSSTAAAAEALGHGKVVVLGAGDGEIVSEHPAAEGAWWSAVGMHDLVEGAGEHAGFEARGAEDHLLRDGDALDGEHLLGVDGAVAGDGVGFEFGDSVEIFEADAGEVGAGEFVLDGVAGGASLA
jgi:hypothetical protein